MSLRDQIQRIYEEEGNEGLDELWRWAKGDVERWEALKDWAQRKVDVFDDQLERSRERHDEASEILHQLADDAADLAERLTQTRELIQQAEELGHEDLVLKRRERARELIAERDGLKEKLESHEVQEKKTAVRERQALQERRAWIERKVTYRDKWDAVKRRLAESGEAEWEDFMANGRPLNFSSSAKAEAAIAVVKFDCVVTSTFRATVISVSSSGSFHGPNVNPGKAVDVAGSRMVEYQQDVFNRRSGDSSLLELFGPTNSVALKFGSPLVLAEGTFLENLHDTHVHVAVEG